MFLAKIKNARRFDEFKKKISEIIDTHTSSVHIDFIQKVEQTTLPLFVLFHTKLNAVREELHEKATNYM